MLAVAAVGSLLWGSPAPAQGAAEPVILGVLELQLSPGARVTAEPEIQDGRFSISLWHQRGAIGPQVSAATLPFLRSFHTVPGSAQALRLDLRLAPEVHGVEIQRDGEHLRLVFTDHRFAGSALRLQRRRVQEALDRRRNQHEDEALSDLLTQPRAAAPTWVDQPPILWPIGAESPVRPLLPLDPRPRRVPPAPAELRAAWAASEPLARSWTQAQAGDLAAALRSLSRLPMPDDDTRALVAALRGTIYATPRRAGEPYAPGLAASAFVLASALRPAAPWAAWARGMAGYGYERENNFIEAQVHYARAVEMAPESDERVFWETGRGVAAIQARRVERGVEAIRAFDGALRERDAPLRFELRRTVAWGLWRDGEYAQAAAVADLILSEHAVLARDAALRPFWARIYLDAGRGAAALPFLQGMLKEGERVDRERARWWLHEVALQGLDVTQARRLLRQIVDETPGSTLVPLARTRLLVLDAVATGGKGNGLSWQEVSLKLRKVALQWPHTVVEGEALSYVAQLWLELGLIQDAVDLYAWIEDRNPGGRGPVARDEFLCRAAPRAFRELRALGQVTRALGVYRGFLDDPALHGCVDPQLRDDAAQSATLAGLPGLAARWLGQAVAEGASDAEEAVHLVALADSYLRQGKIDAADQTLVYLENSDLPRPSPGFTAARGDVLRGQERWAESLAAYDAAIEEAAATVRGRGGLPTLRYHRGLVLHALKEDPRALVELRSGVEQGGADDPVLGWLTVASVGAGIATTAEDWNGVLHAVDAAGAEEPGASRARALRYYRAAALEGLGDADGSDALLKELSEGTDAWALRARETRSRAAFDVSLDALSHPSSD